MNSVIKLSSHDLANRLLEMPEGPIRALIIGRAVLSWNGKPGDIIEKIDTDAFFGDE